MADTREAVLVRLLAILTAIVGGPPVGSFGNPLGAYRNRGSLPIDKRPALVVLDGTESVQPFANAPRHLVTPPCLVTMLPQFFVVLKPRDNPDNVNVGPELNAYRQRLVRDIITDAPLRALLGSNGQIAYRGVATDMQTGSAIKGELQLNLALTYAFDPSAPL